jgi:hypothetical protein
MITPPRAQGHMALHELATEMRHDRVNTMSTQGID